MRLALDAAHQCTDHDDVPVGCVIVRDADGEVVATAGNARERLQDPTAHAEILALREAAGRARSWHLEDHTLYVTLEPCAMCAGAIVLARIARVVFGAGDPKAGFAGSIGNLVSDPRLNHRAEVTAGVLADECGEVLRDFFRSRR
jgi:tRNA(adenine34) deaminase